MTVGLGYSLAGALIVLLVPGWWLLLMPCWHGLRQTLRLSHPFDDAIVQAWRGVTASLDELREVSQTWASRAMGQIEADAGDWLSRQWQQLTGKAPAGTTKTGGALSDFQILLKGGLPVYSQWDSTFRPRVESWTELQARERLHLVRDLCAWVDQPEVAPVLAAAGRRVGMEDVVTTKKSELHRRGLEGAGQLAHRGWYALYCGVVFQVVVLVGLSSLGFHRAMKPALWILVGLNAANVLFALREAWPVLHLTVRERRTLREIAERVGIPNPVRSAGRVLLLQVTAALFLGAFALRTAIVLDQDRVLPALRSTVKYLVWELPGEVLYDAIRYGAR